MKHDHSSNSSNVHQVETEGMKLNYNTNYPTVEDLRERARVRMPKFAFEYLDGGCNEEINLQKNNSDISKVELKPVYLNEYKGSDMSTELFGNTYDAPFGISPIGLQGLIWPDSANILARAAYDHNSPFILSTVSTSSIEKISEITEGRFWFQLYNPTEREMRDKIIKRAEDSGCKVLVVLCDVPTFGYRPKDIKNGLAMPPRMTIKNVAQMIGKPAWAINTLIHGQPKFETLIPYMPKGLDLRGLGRFMNETFSGRLNEENVSRIRDMWKGKLVLKGVASEEDTEKAIKLGFDGVIISNHGGRQLDAGQSTIEVLKAVYPLYGNKIKIMMDSGIRSGADIARVLACGADFAFMGRAFMYGVGALGKEGGQHTISIFKIQLRQVMEQIGCEKISDFPKHLVGK